MDLKKNLTNISAVILLLLLLLTCINNAKAEKILFDDFESTPSYTQNTPFNKPFGAQMDYAPFESGTQQPSVSSTMSLTGQKSFGFGNAKLNYAFSTIGKVGVKYTISASSHKNKKIGYWVKVTVDSQGSLRVVADNKLVNIFNFTNTYTNTPLSTGWQYKEVALPDGASLIELEMYGRNSYPQQTDPRWSNAYIDRITVTGDRVDGTPGGEDIPALLSIEDARLDVDTTCGRTPECVCPLPDGYDTCASDALDALSSSSRITAANLTALKDELASLLLYCTGFTECKDTTPVVDAVLVKQEGFEEGVASVDVETIRSAGFDAGVSSIDTGALTQVGFEEGVASVDVETIRSAGFDAGVSSIDTGALAQAGFEEGFTAGVNSVDVITIKRVAYDEGVATCIVLTPAPTVVPTAAPTVVPDKDRHHGKDKRVTVCHKCDKKDHGSNLTISENGLRGHLSHGDTLGKCGGK